MTPLSKRREAFGVLFVHDLLSGNIDSPSLLSCISINARPRLTRVHNFIYPDNHRTNYGFYEPLTASARSYNNNSLLIDFNMSRASIMHALINN